MSRIAFLFALLLIFPAARADDAAKLARMRLAEAESVANLTTEGRALYDADGVKQQWGQYCATAVQLADAGQLREAVRSAVKALFLGSEGRNDQAMAYAKRDLSMIFSYAGNLSRAEQYATEALQHARRGGSWPEISVVAYKVLGDIRMRQGHPAEAIDEYKKALDEATRNVKFFPQVSLANALVAARRTEDARKLLDDVGMPSRADRRQLLQRTRAALLLAEGKPAEAVKLFEDALAELKGQENDYARVFALQGLGRAQLAAGNRAAAVKAYLEAVQVAESVRARFHNEEFKSGLFGEMQQVFDQAVSLLAEDGDSDRAFEISERGRSRALLDLVRNRVQIGQGSAAFTESFTASQSLSDIRAGLPDGTVLVEYHVLPGRTLVWVVRRAGVQLASVPIERDALARLVEHFRDALIDRRVIATELGAGLYERLIIPLALKDGENLVIVPHASLHYLPFQALGDGKSYLIERHAIAYAPSAAVLAGLLRRPLMSKAMPVLGIGNPDLNNPALALPAAQREVERLKSVFPDAQIFVQKEATKDRVMQMANSMRLVHIAAHAEVDNIDPLYSRIKLAGNLKESGDLEAREVYGMNLSSCQLVVLSACDSGLGRVSNGDEIWGFTRAFLGAGTASLLVSLWPVADESTEQLMSIFYGALVKGNDRREALRQAQLALLKDERFRAPFFWAPFNLIGDSR